MHVFHIHLLLMLLSPLKPTRGPKGPESLTWIRLIMPCYEEEVLKLYLATLTFANFQSNQHVFLEEMYFEEIQDGRIGCHFRYLKVMILANLRSHIDRCPLQSFSSIQHVCFIDVI